MNLNLSARYRESCNQLTRAEKTIPLGSQTFSKSRTQLPVGASPLFAAKSLGSRTWDIDGNEYIDLVNSLGAVILGFGDPEVTESVERQLRDGVTFSLAHPLEAEVAERIVELVPCADAVRFGKTGSDATAACIRLARAATGREHVIACGYHGWQDWYIGSTSMSLGVPEGTRSLTHVVPFNDAAALEEKLYELKGKVAALILEPMNSQWPLPGYLEEVRRLTQEEEVILIFDEVVTGFRLAPGGAQELFGVVPDLSSLGKALGNGFPISAIAGRHDLMNLMNRVFFSGTHGGETLSLAASRVVLDRVAKHQVTQQLALTGEHLLREIELRLPDGCSSLVGFSGHPAWTFLEWQIEDPEELVGIKTLFLQEMLRRGVLVLSSHNVSTALTPSDVEEVAAAYSESLSVILEAVQLDEVLERLQCEPIRPLFQVRR